MLWQPTRGILQPNQHWRRGQGAGGGGGDAAETTAFLARTTGLDGTHTQAYKDLINGLVADGVFAKFDALYILAAQDATNAVLNLVSSSFTLSAVGGAPTFTADHGYQSTGGGLTTSFNPSTAGSPKFTQNSAHYSVWNNTNSTNTSPIMGQGTGNNFYIKYTDNNMYGRINDNAESGGTTNTSPVGLNHANRSSSSAIEKYVNGSSIGTASSTSKAVVNSDIKLFNDGVLGYDTVHQIASASIGSSLSSTDASNFYTRMQTYMTAVGN